LTCGRVPKHSLPLQVSCNLFELSVLRSRLSREVFCDRAHGAEELLFESLRTSKDIRRPFVNYNSAIMSLGAPSGLRQVVVSVKGP
jgi:hypothetical protein